MKKDIILCGVGGQGILSIATVIGEAATAAGLYLKQAEVHGMSQRGGDVQSHLRLSSEPIYSDLIPLGGADLIVSMEPMEALRYLPWLGAEGTVVTASKPLVNIPDYPEEAALHAELSKVPHLVCEDIDAMAAKAGNPRGANMALLGLAAPYIGILDRNALREAMKRVFTPKGEAVVAMNLKCYDLEQS
ncbi:MAG: indolepyruvate oxidoreductase subunit beta [Bacteroidales bacterium]|nr:indolepyruvate oxidoreductase subunit beta [Bacteroidales bacterium]